jgi:hypothetical protein
METGFLTFCATFEVRNRLMHPKKPFDIEVNANNIEIADKGIAWFNETCADIFSQCRTRIAQNIENILAQQTK